MKNLYFVHVLGWLFCLELFSKLPAVSHCLQGQDFGASTADITLYCTHTACSDGQHLSATD
jgi:hypothetical protein